MFRKYHPQSQFKGDPKRLLYFLGVLVENHLWYNKCFSHFMYTAPNRRLLLCR